MKHNDCTTLLSEVYTNVSGMLRFFEAICKAVPTLPLGEDSKRELKSSLDFSLAASRSAHRVLVDLLYKTCVQNTDEGGEV